MQCIFIYATYRGGGNVYIYMPLGGEELMDIALWHIVEKTYAYWDLKAYKRNSKINIRNSLISCTYK
jgi:hypothetical protein